MKADKALVYASFFVLLVFAAVGLSKPDCEDGIVKSSLSMISIFGAFPVAGVYLGLKGKRENRTMYCAWGILFGMPALLAYLYFAFGTESCASILSLLGKSISEGIPIITLLSMAIPLFVTQYITAKRANRAGDGKSE